MASWGGRWPHHRRRNRDEPDLAQLVMWSIILLSACLVIGLYNYGFGGL